MKGERKKNRERKKRKKEKQRNYQLKEKRLKGYMQKRLMPDRISLFTNCNSLRVSAPVTSPTPIIFES